MGSRSTLVVLGHCQHEGGEGGCLGPLYKTQPLVLLHSQHSGPAAPGHALRLAAQRCLHDRAEPVLGVLQMPLSQ